MGLSANFSWQTDGQELLQARAAAFNDYMSAAGWLTPEGGTSVEGGESEFHRTVCVRVLPIQQKLAIRAAACLWTLVLTPFLTDYIAPLIVGFAPLIVHAVRAIPPHSI
jgi:hypothetical protein